MRLTTKTGCVSRYALETYDAAIAAGQEVDSGTGTHLLECSHCRATLLALALGEIPHSKLQTAGDLAQTPPRSRHNWFLRYRRRVVFVTATLVAAFLLIIAMSLLRPKNALLAVGPEIATNDMDFNVEFLPADAELCTDRYLDFGALVLAVDEGRNTSAPKLPTDGPGVASAPSARSGRAPRREFSVGTIRSPDRMESRDISAQVLQVAGERGSAPVDLVDPADVLARADVMLITYLDAGKPAKSLIDFSVEKRGRMLYCTARYPPPDDRVLFQRELPLSAPELAKGAAGRAFVVLAIAQSSRCLIAQEHATVESQSRFDDLYSCLTDMSKKVKAEKAHSRETAMLGMSDVADESFNQFIKALDEVGRVHLVLPYLPEALKNVLLNDNPRMTSISETRRLGRN